MKRLMTACAALTGVLAASAITTSAVAEEIVIRFSHVVNESGHPKGEAAALFAERVNEELAGQVRVEIFPNSQLYNDDQVLEALLLGDAQMAAPSLSKFEQFTLQYRVFDLPFLFENIEAVNRFQQSDTGQDLLGAMTEQGLYGLTFWHNGMKQMSADVPLLTPADAEGLKFRIQTSDVLEAQFLALGASPQKMAFSEVYGALQTGVVNGQENTWSNIFTKRFFEVQDGITETDHGIIDYMVVTSVEFWDGLPDDIRADLERILHEVTEERNGEARQINLDSRQAVLDAGTEIRQLTPEQRAAWVDAMKPVWDQFADQIGADVIEAAVASNSGS